MPQTITINNLPFDLIANFIREAPDGEMTVLEPTAAIAAQTQSGQNVWVRISTIQNGLTQNVVYIFSPVDMGVYVAGTQYQKGDYVSYQGSTYIFNGPVPLTGSTPPNANWVRMSSDGINAVATTTNSTAVSAPAIGSNFTIALNDTRGLNETVRYQFGSLGKATLVSKTLTTGQFTNNSIAQNTNITSGILVSPASGDAGVQGIPGVSAGHRYTVSTSAPGANGVLQASSATSLVIRNLDSDGLSPTGLSTTLPIGSQIWIIDTVSSANRVVFTTTALPTIASNNFTIAGTSSTLGTLPTTSNGVRLLIFPNGNPGSNGTDGITAGLPYVIRNAVPAANGDIFFASPTLLQIRASDVNGNPIATLLNSFPLNSKIAVVRSNSPTNRRDFAVTGPVSVANNIYDIPVTGNTTGTFNAGDSVSVVFDAAGQPGTNGLTGISPGQAYKFYTGASTPSGGVRFSGGILYLHESDRTTPTANNLTTLWEGLTPESVIEIRDESTPTTFANYRLGTWAGNPPKNGSVYELPATTAGASATAIADTADVRISFGLKGLQGTPGAGSTIAIQEADGTPSGAASTLIVPNGSLAISGNNATLTFPTASGMAIRELDGTPTGTFQTLEVPNGSLTDQGNGVARLNFSTGNTGSSILLDDPFNGSGQITSRVPSIGQEWLPALTNQDIGVISNGKATFATSEASFSGWVSDVLQTRYEINCEFDNFSASGTLAIYFRYINSNNLYYLQFNSNQAQLYSVINGVFTQVFSANFSLIALNTARVIVNENSIVCFCNNQVLGGTTSFSIAEGSKAGFAMNKAFSTSINSYTVSKY